MIKNGRSILLLTIFFALTGCYTQQAYYVSPFNGDSPGYHSIPLKADSLKSAFYINGAYFGGLANEGGRDAVRTFHTEIAGAHNIGSFQGWYGLGLSLGNYSVTRWDSSFYNYLGHSPSSSARTATPFDAKIIDQNAGNKFFGGTGFSGGINGVLPTNRSEWRFLGIETSLEREFGDYLQFRKQLPDSAATLIERSNFFGTLGFYTELLGKTRQGNFGFRFATGIILGRSYNNLNIYDNQSKHNLRYSYTNFTFHYTLLRYTGYWQLDFATKASGSHFGLNYRIGK